jgi:hypothetical protein
MVIGLLVVGLALVHALGRIIGGDIRGQVELIAIVLLLVFVAFPVRLIAKSVGRSRLGRFIHANPRTSTLVDMKRLKVTVRDEPNSLLVVQVFAAVLFVLILVVAAMVAAVRWLLG